MADWQIYWSDFIHERHAGKWPSGRKAPFEWWRTSNWRLKDNLRENDNLWMFTSGKLCKYADEPRVYQVFLVQLLRVKEIVHNPDFNPAERPDAIYNPKYRLYVQKDRAIAINPPPQLVEDIMFPQKREFPPVQGDSAGERLQAPRVMDAHKLRAIKALLKRQP